MEYTAVLNHFINKKKGLNHVTKETCLGVANAKPNKGCIFLIKSASNQDILLPNMHNC